MLKRSRHPQAQVKLGACYLELALIAARRRDGDRAHALARKAAETIDSAPPTSDAFIETDRRFYRNQRLPEVAQELADAGIYHVARKMFEHATQKSPDDPWPWYHRAIAELGCGDEAAYRNIRAELLTRFGSGEQPSDRIAYVFAPIPLAEPAGDQRPALAAIAEKLSDPRPRAAVLYRLGRYEDAIACLQERNDGRAWDHLLMALSHARLGQPDCAGQSLQSALDWLDEVKAGIQQPGWTERLETQFLLDEARGLQIHRDASPNSHSTGKRSSPTSPLQ